MRRRYWLAFDLGLRGNYESLYEWLDNMEARECSDSMATFITEKSRADITAELSGILDGEKARIYIVGRVQRDFAGRFILGKRKRAPWTGYGGRPVLDGGEDT